MELPEKIHPEITRLSNGMRLITCARPHIHRIMLMLNVSAGCRDERLNGTAHMLEHLIFRGTDEYPSLRELSEAFETRGADFNAFTAREVTSFEVTTPPESAHDILKLLSSAILHPRLTGISAERDIIREEILPDYGSDGELINEEDLMILEFFGNAGTPIAGNPDDLARITKSEVLQFYDANYRAERMTLVAVGAIGDTARFAREVETAFSDVRHAEAPRQMRQVDSGYAASFADFGTHSPAPRLVYTRNDGATQSELSMGWLNPGVHSRDFLGLSLLVRVLDDGMASRLSRHLVEELALVYDAEANLSVTSDATLMQIHASCRHRRVPRLVSAVYELLDRIAADGIGTDEYTRIRKRIVWEHRALLDDASGLCSWISSMDQQKMSVEPCAFCEALLSVTRDEIRDAAATVLTRRPHLVSLSGELGNKIQAEIQSIIQSQRKQQM